MHLAAQTVPEDCRQAAALFTPGLQGSQWRIAFMANLALLRTVYHVLKSRDAAVDPEFHRLGELEYHYAMNEGVFSWRD
jgi:hypothetical protein